MILGLTFFVMPYFFPDYIWTSIFLLYLDLYIPFYLGFHFPFLFEVLYPLSIWAFISAEKSMQVNDFFFEKLTTVQHGYSAA